MASASSLRQTFLNIRSNKIFELFVISIIILSALLIGAKTYAIDSRIEQIVSILDTAVTLIFLFEVFIRMAAEERLRDFFKSGWNVFDFVIVVVSLLPINESEMALLARLLRIFRVLRLISIIPELRILMNALITAIPRMGYVVLLMFIIFYIYAAIGSFLFEAINPVLWDNVSISMLTLFRVATFEDWTDVMYETMTIYPFSWIYYLSFIFLTAFVFLNMMIGIVLEVLQNEHEKYNQEQGIGEAAEVHWLRNHAEEMEQRLVRMEAMLVALGDKKLKDS
ncbi:MAG: ion transporter [Gammaproteobacteria bacterium]|nr:ion transporter [Gammaproteobacteria bacterium]